ncbi:MAG: hypothetical protein K9H48_14670 [Melioribacteraceae bacterium]|nr:hypothetical protein [Melioribacteraceae bacterium]MCF8395320.1 hypothetical protein [Melioribacteraceae bacterium]MCF8420342.1 hypothetical protein [Melioribacteraceae bacterium]
MKYIVLLLSILPLFLISCQEDNFSPNEVAKEYFKASYKMDWSKITKLMHPNSLSKFRKNILTVAVMADSNFKADDTFDTLSTIKSYHVDTLFSFLRNNKTSTLSDSEFFYSYCKTVYPNLQQSLNVQPDSIINLGFLKEGFDTAHVLTRINITKSGTELSGIMILSLAKHQNSWRVLLPDELENKLKMQLAIRRTKYINN